MSNSRCVLSLNSDPLLLTRNIQFPNWNRCRWLPKLWEVFSQQTRLWTGTWLGDLRSNYKMANATNCITTHTHLLLSTSIFKHIQTHMYTDFPSFLPSDRQAALFLHTEIFTQLFGRCCCQPPPPFLLPPSSLSLSLTIAKTDPLASTKKLFSQNRRNLSKPQPTQECLYPLFSPTPSLHEKKTAHLAHPLGPQTSLAHNS